MRRFFHSTIIAFTAAAFPTAAAYAAEPPTASSPHLPATDEAERIYGQYGDAIYQVQVIDLASGKKSSIGSGFVFTDGGTEQGLIATNYHVVAEAVQRPEANRLEYLHDKGERGNLIILMADAVHDLAILRMETPAKNSALKSVALGTSKLPKGARLFSLGNPHDIGFTIVEGTYNGLSSESFIDKIHFSGALNPGMSGGPALGHDGKVAGINVATAGNQIGFLVPVEPLRDLLNAWRAQPADYDFLKDADSYIETQLLKLQDDNIKKLLAQPWDSVSFGGLQLPGRIDPVFKCWGAAAHQEKDPYTYYRSNCASQDNIFLDDDFTTGTYSYEYDALRPKEDPKDKSQKMGVSRFYNFYEQQYIAPPEDAQNAGEGDVTNFSCNSKFVKAAGHTWKSAFCVRKYKSYPALHDMRLYMALVGEGARGLVLSMTADGLSKTNALALAARFISEIKQPDVKKASDKREDK